MIVSAKLQNTGPLIYILLNHIIVPIVFHFVFQKVLTHVKQVVQSGPVFCSTLLHALSSDFVSFKENI